MPRVNRREIFAGDEIQAFHLINRCVRRTWLCGRDKKSGKDYSHRKQWIRDRLEVLAGIFGLDVLGFAVLSNHMHVVVRTRPDVVKTWSDDEVALRWWNLFPQRKNKDGTPAVPTEAELDHVRKNTSGMQEKRRRLSNVSWFMKCLSEPIAKRGNREEKVSGHFWEARYKAQPLLDETAITACMAYVDLNPIRAGLAASPETSEFTSVKERISDRQEVPSMSSAETRAQRIEHGEKAGWLAPIELHSQRGNVREQPTVRRASSKGCLAMTLDEYLRLLDWTGRQLCKDKVGRIPVEFAPILDRLDCSGESWLDLVKNFRKRFRTEAGRAVTLQNVSSIRRACRHANSSA